MRVTIDIDKLLAQGRITREEYERIKSFATENTMHLSINVFISFGVVAAVLGTLLLVPDPKMALGLGLGLAILGMTGQKQEGDGLALLMTVMISVGTLLASGGILVLTDGSIGGHLLVASLCSVGGIVSKRKALLVVATLALSATIGAMAMYSHASYGLIIRQPFLTVLVFTILGWSMYYYSLSLSWDYQPLALTVARTSFILVNFGFWVGSLWGDDLWLWHTHGSDDDDKWVFGYGQAIPDLVFGITWALGIVAMGVWGAIHARGWVVNAAATFAGIHFYTQFFERLGASPKTLFGAGVVALVICVVLTNYNQKLDPTNPTSSADGENLSSSNDNECMPFTEATVPTDDSGPVIEESGSFPLATNYTGSFGGAADIETMHSN